MKDFSWHKLLLKTICQVWIFDEITQNIKLYLNLRCWSVSCRHCLCLRGFASQTYSTHLNSLHLVTGWPRVPFVVVLQCEDSTSVGTLAHKGHLGCQICVMVVTNEKCLSLLVKNGILMVASPNQFVLFWACHLTFIHLRHELVRVEKEKLTLLLTHLSWVVAISSYWHSFDDRGAHSSTSTRALQRTVISKNPGKQECQVTVAFYWKTCISIHSKYTI